MEICQNGLQLDLRALNTLVVDAEANTVTVGPGVRFRDLMKPLHAAGKQMSTAPSSAISKNITESFFQL
jgi:FAD/FMN-containing dehydrogenase